MARSSEDMHTVPYTTLSYKFCFSQYACLCKQVEGDGHI